MTNKIVKRGLALGLVLGTVALGVTLVGPAFADEHGRDNDRGRGHGEYRHHDDYRGRDVYEGAPPVVIAPQGYYTQPGAALTFSLPFFR